MKMMVRKTKTVQGRYNRSASFYDLGTLLVERFLFHRWRQELWRRVRGPLVLEVGVGTGANFPYYPRDVEVVAVDFSPRMLEKAREKRDRMALPVSLALMDAQRLAFSDHIFDSVVATFTFCSVPYPRIGLRELGRVCKEKGQVLLLEHVLSQEPLLREMMNLLNPLAVRMGGENINRDTPRNVRSCGLRLIAEEDLLGDVVKLLEASPAED